MEAEHRAKEAAGKAAEELKTLNTELQVSMCPNRPCWQHDVIVNRRESVMGSPTTGA